MINVTLTSIKFISKKKNLFRQDLTIFSVLIKIITKSIKIKCTECLPERYLLGIPGNVNEFFFNLKMVGKLYKLGDMNTYLHYNT